MTDPRDTLARIRKQADAATEGPWEVKPYYDGAPEGTDHVNSIVGPRQAIIIEQLGCGCCDVGLNVEHADAEFVTHARTTVPALLDLADAVLERHVKAQPIPAAYGTQEGGDYCAACADDWPCPDYTAATTALEAIK